MAREKAGIEMVAVFIGGVLLTLLVMWAIAAAVL